MKESTARIGDGRTDGRTLTTGLEVNAFRAVGRKSNSIMYRKSGCIVKKDRFYNGRHNFYIENEVFYRRK